MSPETPFAELLQKVRAGDPAAAEELLRRYEPEIRRVVRYRLKSTQLRRHLDSMDICQSVLADFFVRAALGQYELTQSEDLLKLLVTMTRNKLTSQVRKQMAQKRPDHRRGMPIDPEDSRFAADTTPSQIVAGDELIREFRQRLTDEERQLADRRTEGQGWEAIAAALGGTAQARRKQLERAVSRITRELGLETE